MGIGAHSKHTGIPCILPVAHDACQSHAYRLHRLLLQCDLVAICRTIVKLAMYAKFHPNLNHKNHQAFIYSSVQYAWVKNYGSWVTVRCQHLFLCFLMHAYLLYSEFNFFAFCQLYTLYVWYTDCTDYCYNVTWWQNAGQ